MNIEVPEFSTLVLIGISGSGKSTFAARHFLPTEIISSDRCRALVCDDENDQGATADAFALVQFILERRLARMKLSVLDATHVQPGSRDDLLRLAKAYHCPATAIVLDLPLAVCQERNRGRQARHVPECILLEQHAQLQRTLARLDNQKFRAVHRLGDPAEIESVRFQRSPMPADRRGDSGPFDIIGDIHGCYGELLALLAALGYQVDEHRIEGEASAVSHPQGRRVILLGDMVDRGPDTPAVLALAMNMVAAGQALCVAGNHEIKLRRHLSGRQVSPTHGLEASIRQMGRKSGAFCRKVRAFIEGLADHYVLDEGRLVVAHAGLKGSMQGRTGGAVRAFAYYGETSGEIDEFGLPIRCDWARDYRGDAAVVYGHTPVPTAEWVNGTICLDTGCVFGGKLTALRYPERELVAVPAVARHYQSARPFPTAVTSANGKAVPPLRTGGDPVREHS